MDQFSAPKEATADVQAAFAVAAHLDPGEAIKEGLRLWLLLWPVMLPAVLLVELPVSILTTWITQIETLSLSQSVRLTTQVANAALLFETAALYSLIGGRIRGEGSGLGTALAGGVALVIPLYFAWIIPNIVTVVGLCFLVVPGLYAGTRFGFVTAALCLDRDDPCSAAKRSLALTDSVFWPAFWVLAASVCVALVTGVVQAGGYFVLVAGLTGLEEMGIPIAYNMMDGAGSLLIDLVLGYFYLLGPCFLVPMYFGLKEAAVDGAPL